MPVYHIPEYNVTFPDPMLAAPDGLLAVGGNLEPETLVAAYSQGIFPWYSDEYPRLWWSPDPRFLLFPGEFHCPKSLRRVLHKMERGEGFSCTRDTAFAEVIAACAEARKDDTWLVEEMIAAYRHLHSLHLAHSFEVWHQGRLAGGLYGVSLGRAFFAESMFFRVPDAGKVALVQLVHFALNNHFLFIDCQQETDNLLRFGARGIPRQQFLALLQTALRHPTLHQPWTSL
jgi:leucyl/phenylalanyl-tRNA--protein transferase